MGGAHNTQLRNPISWPLAISRPTPAPLSSWKIVALFTIRFLYSCLYISYVRFSSSTRDPAVGWQVKKKCRNTNVVSPIDQLYSHRRERIFRFSNVWQKKKKNHSILIKLMFFCCLRRCEDGLGGIIIIIFFSSAS